MMDQSTYRWYAVYVPFRREKSASERLERMGIETYVPLIEKTKRYVRKVKKYRIPLINKYVFVRIAMKDKNRVLQERDVIDFLRFEGRMAAIPDSEIETLKRVVGDREAQVNSIETGEAIGAEVEIIHGHLTGLKGVVREVLGKNKVLVTLETLGLTLGIQVPSKYLSPVLA